MAARKHTYSLFQTTLMKGSKQRLVLQADVATGFSADIHDRVQEPVGNPTPPPPVSCVLSTVLSIKA